MNGFIVSRPNCGSGVGSNLASLAGALWLAQRLRRTLLIDWRGQSELADKRLNYFAEFLSLPRSLGGVDVVPVPHGDTPFAQVGASVGWLEPSDARAFGTGAATPTADYLALKTYHGLDRVHPGPPSERFRFLRGFYRALTPQAEVAAAVEEWMETFFSAFGFVIGVHVRTGNGSRDFQTGGKYAFRVDRRLFDDETRFVRLLDRACAQITKKLPRPVRESVAVFHTTDNAEMSAILSRLPNAITRRTAFPPVGVDHQYAFTGSDRADRDGVIDTLADMFLLARCDGLVHNSSLFNQYARVVTGCFGGGQIHFEMMPLRKRAHFAVELLRRRLTNAVSSR